LGSIGGYAPWKYGSTAAFAARTGILVPTSLQAWHANNANALRVAGVLLPPAGGRIGECCPCNRNDGRETVLGARASSSLRH
jgi:hypothetical protein